MSLVTNLTDVATDALKQRGLVGVQIAVGDVLLAPGASTEVADISSVRAGIQPFLDAQALHVGAKLPATYLASKPAVPPTTSPSPTSSTSETSDVVPAGTSGASTGSPVLVKRGGSR